MYYYNNHTTVHMYVFHSTLMWTLTPAGVSVCLRYLTDGRYSTIFKLSPSNTPLTLTVTYPDQYTLSFGGYYSLSLQPNIRFWSHIDPDIWTRVCLTVDTRKNVAQVFSGSSISIRKMLPVKVRAEFWYNGLIIRWNFICTAKRTGDVGSDVSSGNRQIDEACSGRFHVWKGL